MTIVEMLRACGDNISNEAATEIERLERIEEAAQYYLFAGQPGTDEYLLRRGWRFNPDRRVWISPEGYPPNTHASELIACAIELEMSLGLHR